MPTIDDLIAKKKQLETELTEFVNEINLKISYQRGRIQMLEDLINPPKTEKELEIPVESVKKGS